MATINTFNPSSPISGLFQNPLDDLNKELDERAKKLMAAARVGSPGPISTLLGYSGIPDYSTPSY